MTLSRSYLISSDWFPELRLLEKTPTWFHMHHNDLVHQPIFCLNLFSKAKTLAPVRMRGTLDREPWRLRCSLACGWKGMILFWNLQSHPIVILECPILYFF